MSGRTLPGEPGASFDLDWVGRYDVSNSSDWDSPRTGFHDIGVTLEPVTPASDACVQSEPCVAVAIRPTYGASPEAVRRQLLDLLVEPPARVLVDEWRVLALFSNESHLNRPLQRRTFFRRLHHGLKAASGRLALGWSCMHTGTRGWQRACAEANQALSMVIHVLGPGQAAAFAEVAILSLVSGSRDPTYLRLLQDQLLGPLWLHDQEERMDLAGTLEIYLESACNASQTAELLRVHRNSVSNRLQRIKELCDVDVEDPDMRLLVQLILRSVRGAHIDSPLAPDTVRPPGIWAAGGVAPRVNGLSADPTAPSVFRESAQLAETRASTNPEERHAGYARPLTASNSSLASVTNR